MACTRRPLPTGLMAALPDVSLIADRAARQRAMRQYETDRRNAAAYEQRRRSQPPPPPPPPPPVVVNVELPPTMAADMAAAATRAVATAIIEADAARADYFNPYGDNDEEEEGEPLSPPTHSLAAVRQQTPDETETVDATGSDKVGGDVGALTARLENLSMALARPRRRARPPVAAQQARGKGTSASSESPFARERRRSRSASKQPKSRPPPPLPADAERQSARQRAVKASERPPPPPPGAARSTLTPARTGTGQAKRAAGGGSGGFAALVASKLEPILDDSDVATGYYRLTDETLRVQSNDIEDLVDTVVSNKYAGKRSVAWLGGSPNNDPPRHKKGDVTFGFHDNATVKEKWDNEAFWETLIQRQKKIVAIDAGSDSWMGSVAVNLLRAYASDSHCATDHFIFELTSGRGRGKFRSADPVDVEYIFPVSHFTYEFKMGPNPGAVPFAIVRRKSSGKGGDATEQPGANVVDLSAPEYADLSQMERMLLERG